jgi:hypothetical protein
MILPGVQCQSYYFMYWNPNSSAALLRISDVGIGPPVLVTGSVNLSLQSHQPSVQSRWDADQFVIGLA